MDLTAARTLAENLIAKHLPSGWTFAFDTATTRLGQCNETRKRITMSQQFVAAEEQSAVEQVLFHEVGHAIAGARAKHGPTWHAAARRLGYTGKATVRHEDTAEGADLIERTLAAADLVKDRTSGPLVMGEKVHFLGGKQGLFVEARRTRAVIWSPTRRRLTTVAINELARIGQVAPARQAQRTPAPAASQSSVRRAASLSTEPVAEGDHVVIVKPRSKYNGLTGIVERPAGQSWRIRLDNNAGILTAAKSLVRKAA